MIKAIFLDLGGVMVLSKIREIGEKYQQKYGLTKEMVKEIFDYKQQGSRSPGELDNFLKLKGVSPIIWHEFTLEFFNSEYKNQALYKSLLKAKTKTGLKIVFTTNNSAGLDEVLIKYEIKDLADLTVNSSHIGVLKPDPVYWQKALEITRLNGLENLKTSQVLVIDDSLANIESAKKLDYKTVLYRQDEDVHQVIREMLG